MPRSAVQYIRGIGASKVTAALRRRLLEPVTIRLLNLRDLEALLTFAGQYLAVPPHFLKQQLRKRWGSHGVAAGAFGRNGRMCGFAYVDQYTQEGLDLEGFWIRSLFVAPIARRMAIGRRLVECLCQHAAAQGIDRVFADIDRRNESSVHLFLTQGFAPSKPELLAQVQREWWKKGSNVSWTVLERPLRPAPTQN